MRDIKIQKDDGPVGFIKGVFGFKRKGYAEIMSTFMTVKNELNTLIENNESDIKCINEEIKKLEDEKSIVVEEKGKAVETLAFLNKMVKG